MPPTFEGDCTSEAYWDDRVKRSKNLKQMIFIDSRFDEYEKRTRCLLETWKDGSAIDVACGYGRFSDIFADYLGFDFSEEMVKLAHERNPGKRFSHMDVKKEGIKAKADYVFEVNSLKSLGMDAETFFNLFSPHAKKAVACLEADSFIIKQIYDQKR